MRALARLSLAVVWVSPLIAQQPPSPTISPLQPATTGGIAAVDGALVKLSSHRRLLVVGAHPDDEDTTLLAYVGTGLGGEAAYLSLSRGEGGQNLIGPELGVSLGLIRSGELMAARQIEGSRQYFTRAFDFGYTRSLDETFGRWPKTTLLEDAVRTLRRFKPQVVVAVFPGEGRTGHGQHQASGVVAEEAFRLAGKPDRFPQLTAVGLPPWQPQALYRRVWRNREESTLEFPLDLVEPLTGKSILQVAGASRSMHRSQDMGTLQRLGRRSAGLIWIAGETAAGAVEVFGGIDTSLAAIADSLPPGSPRERARRELRGVAEIAQESRLSLSPADLASAVPALAQIVSILEDLTTALAASGQTPAHRIVVDLLNEKLEIASVGLVAAAGVSLDAVADRAQITVGEVAETTVTLWASGEQEVEVRDVEVVSPAGWRATRQPLPVDEGDNSGLEQWRFQLEVPVDIEPSAPYFLRQQLSSDMYDWDSVAEVDRGEPLQRPPAVAVLHLQISGVPVRVAREIVYRFRDQAVGEVRRPVRAVPRLEVAVSPDLLLWPRSSLERREIEVLLRSHSRVPIAGRLELRTESQWPDLPPVEFTIAEPNGQAVLRIGLDAPDNRSQDRVRVTAVAVLNGGGIYDTAYPVVSYPHVRPLSHPVQADIEIQMLDLELPRARQVGYIRGASDRVPEVLGQIGLPVQILTAAELRTADLSAFEAIVVGSRAYEIDPVLAEINSRLLQYVRDGGLLVVQYQQYQFVRGAFAPLSLEIGRPHGRVTDERAQITVVRPDHRAFQIPNRIGKGDWENWVQERGLYFASNWDPAYMSLLSLQDEGQPLERGALLVAEVGEGLYVYTGLSFFRQLPAGVPGAIRLFVNLLCMETS